MTTPFALSRKEAAEFVGVAPSTFDKLVKSGEMPQPHRFASCNRVVWRVDDLKAAFGKLAVSSCARSVDERDADGWDGVRA